MEQLWEIFHCVVMMHSCGAWTGEMRCSYYLRNRIAVGGGAGNQHGAWQQGRYRGGTGKRIVEDIKFQKGL